MIYYSANDVRWNDDKMSGDKAHSVPSEGSRRGHDEIFLVLFVAKCQQNISIFFVRRLPATRAVGERVTTTRTMRRVKALPLITVVHSK